MANQSTSVVDVLVEARKLIERLERATGPDRELDGAIKAAIDPPPGLDGDANIFVRFDGNGRGRFKTAHGTALSFGAAVPYFTKSIDAALTLVPVKFFPGVSQSVHHLDWYAWLGCVDADGRAEAPFDGNSYASPAIAICIAALKARAIASERAKAGAAS